MVLRFSLFTFLCFALLCFFWISPFSHEQTGKVKGQEKKSSHTPGQEDLEVRESVARGLDFLVSIQRRNGSWKNDVGYKYGHHYERDVYDQSHVGVTALCCMALIAGGHTPISGKYSEHVRQGIEYILGNIQGGHIRANGTRMYSHAFATLLLAEVYGMTNTTRIKTALHETTRFIIKNQVLGGPSSDSLQGGWRYEPGQQDADISITVCQLQALRAARNVGIHVEQSAIDAARRYITLNYEQSDGSFYYQPSWRTGRRSFALTAAGIVSLQSAGNYGSFRDWRGVVIDFRKSLHYLLGYRPDKTTRFSVQGCDFSFWYGHYYAAQAFHQYSYVDETMWVEWNKMNQKHFLSLQQSNGAWIDEIGGWEKETNAYATAMACLILSIPNNYLPIFQN